ncbi:ribosome silencing factor [Anaeromicropila herbilytica]|uniref:Ribosomal silencing factor RsfS n=1 Tax=Anaeromicropila herbilytica TaxID=2785025 RepID=A0A7R7ID66_9FIRM|nr:ribosome silencing factor [Anaeromicropila herbilytica]BCN30709.1 ribosomal silencing factor RsfS [Anaeromicropila herbilytica]
MNLSKEMAKIAYEALDDKKAEDIKVIEVKDITVIADYFVIANGTNSSQVSALVDAVEEGLGKAGYEPKRIEGIGTTNWILLDYGDIVVHIFSREDRLFYDLERIWRDGKTIDKDKL